MKDEFDNFERRADLAVGTACGEPNIKGMRFTATLAKFGIDSPVGGLASPINKENCLKVRNDMRRAVNQASERLHALVDAADKWTKENQKEYEDLLQVIEGAKCAIQIAEGNLSALNMGSKADGVTPAAWKQNGQTIKPLAKSDRLAAQIGHQGIHDGSFGFGEYVKSMVAGTNRQEIRNALTEGTDSAGGYTVPAHLMSQLIDAMRAKTVTVQAGALTIPLETEKTTIARLDSDPQAGWRLERGAVAESDPTFGAVTFTARSLACFVKVSRELLEDSINIDSAIMAAFAGAMAGELDRVALFGSGSAPEPRGLFNTVGVSSVSMGADGAALTNYAKMLDAIYETEISNASAPTAWVMSPRTSRVINGLTDTTGQPLNAPKAVSDIPRLVSSAVPINQTHGAANNASPIILGDFSQLLIGVRTQLRIEVLREMFADTMEYAFLAHLRADIAVAQPKAFAVVKGIVP
jgi:HK97 family phage major capsid protein